MVSRSGITAPPYTCVYGDMIEYIRPSHFFWFLSYILGCVCYFLCFYATGAFTCKHQTRHHHISPPHSVRSSKKRTATATRTLYKYNFLQYIYTMLYIVHIAYSIYHACNHLSFFGLSEVVGDSEEAEDVRDHLMDCGKTVFAVGATGEFKSTEELGRDANLFKTEVLAFVRQALPYVLLKTDGSMERERIVEALYIILDNTRYLFIYTIYIIYKYTYIYITIHIYYTIIHISM